MLSPNYLAHVSDDTLEIYEKLNASIVRDMARRIVKMGEISESTVWQMERLQEAGALYDDVLREIAAITGESQQELGRLFQEAGAKALAFDDAIHIAAGNAPVPLRQSPTMLSVLRTGLEQTNGTLRNLTLTTALTSQQAFVRSADLAFMQVTSGTMDYATAIRRTVESMAGEGAYVLYPTGHRDRIDVAVRRSVLTGVGKTTGEITWARADEMGCDLVETTAHGGARPSHAVWQGGIFSRSGRHARYPDFVASTGYGSGEGLCGWNCRHSFHPFYEGLSLPNYTGDQLKALDEKRITYGGKSYSEYNATQEQRKMERGVRETKRKLTALDAASEEASDKALRNQLREGFVKQSQRLKEQERTLRSFTRSTGLERQNEREQVVGFGRSEAQKAAWAARKGE